MSTAIQPQIIRDGERPEYAVIPYEQFEQMVERLEELIDLHESEKIRARVEAGEEETVPLELVKRIANGESPVRVWREYRGLERRDLAATIGVTDHTLYTIETGRRDPSTRVLRKLADELAVDVDDLLPPAD